MEDFVNIKSLFVSGNERTIENLSEKYSDLNLLKKSILSLFENGYFDKNLKDKRVLIKPNWVKHSIMAGDELCLRTNDNFLLAALEVVLGCSPFSVTIGDAPVQGCIWDKLFNKVFLEEVSKLSWNYQIPVLIKDFRRATFRPSMNKPLRDLKPLSDYLIFNVGERSYLEPVTTSSRNLFRVTNYNPDLMIESHKQGIHKYCIVKELFDVDVILSLPKVKTHQKTGITAALKNIVGINGDKDFLPHHRLGGTGIGGDCYPGKNILRYWAELVMDNANRNQGRPVYNAWETVAYTLWMMSFPKEEHHLAAGWYGNDTCWRMVLDLNKIAIYGRPDGTICSEPQRQIYSLCDGIIGGQGDGPLNPLPLPLGIIVFTNHSALCDIALSILMGFDYKKIPLVNSGEMSIDLSSVKLMFNGSNVSLTELKQYSVTTLPPPGWIKHFQ